MAREAQRKINPADLFTGQTDKYSKFDDKVGVTIELGIPCNVELP